MNLDDEITYEEHTELIFVGTGPSGGVPELGCLIGKSSNCTTCLDSILPGSKNRRRNVCVLIRTTWIPSNPESRKITRNILVDCGKYFWPAALDIFPKFHIDHLDAVIITHAHADAFFGLDDLRDFSNIKDRPTPLPVYVRQQDIPEISKTFPYLMNQGKTENGMHIPALSFQVYDENLPFTTCGLEFKPYQVEHGPGTTCTALSFGNVLYISDCSNIPDSVRQDMLNRFDTTEQDIGVMVLDALWPEKPYNSHFSLQQSISEMKKFRPKKAFTVGMDHSMDYDEYNRKLEMEKQDGLDVELAYDGLSVPIKVPNSSFKSFPAFSPRMTLT